MDLKDITHLFNYTEWANDLAMDAANKLSDENLHRDVGLVTNQYLERWCIWQALNGSG